MDMAAAVFRFTGKITALEMTVAKLLHPLTNKAEQMRRKAHTAVLRQSLPLRGLSCLDGKYMDPHFDLKTYREHGLTIPEEVKGESPSFQVHSLSPRRQEI